MANPINATLPYALRNQLIPVFRSGNFAGPGYAGAMGLETILQNNAVNGGKPILVSELVKTPEGLIAFMKVAIQVQPNGYLDTVTRNHDVEYSLRITSVFAPVHGNVSLQKRCTTQLPRRNGTTVETYRSRLLPRRACFHARGWVNREPNILGNFHQNLYVRKPLSA